MYHSTPVSTIGSTLRYDTSTPRRRKYTSTTEYQGLFLGWSPLHTIPVEVEKSALTVSEFRFYFGLQSSAAINNRGPIKMRFALQSIVALVVAPVAAFEYTCVRTHCAPAFAAMPHPTRPAHPPSAPNFNYTL